MPAYAYPIKVDREKKTITYWEDHNIDEDRLTLALLAPIVGEWTFTISEREVDTGIGSMPDEGYTVSVFKSRQETDEELKARVCREESYMSEYNKRNPK